MPTPNYEVEAVIYVVTRTGIAGVTARASSTEREYYTWRHQDSGNWQLQKYVNGTLTVLGTFSQLLTAGQTVTAKLVCKGSSIEGWVDGVLRASAIDTDITSAGSPGLNTNWAVTETTGFHVNSIEVKALLSTPTLATLTAGYGAITANWSTSDETYIETYAIEYKETAGSTWVEVGVVPASTNTFTINNIDYSTQYDVRIKASNAYGSGDYSNIETTTTLSNVILTDNFTDTDGVLITAHTSDTGQGYVRQAGVPAPADDAEIFNNKIFGRSPNGAYRANFVMPSPDYEVEAVVNVLSNTGILGVTARASSANRTYYVWQYRDGGDGFSLRKFVNGTSTPLVTFAQVLIAGQTVTLKIVCNGNVIKGFVNGVERASVVDNDITSAGSAGLSLVWGVTTTTGLHVDSLVARLL
jgi:hypothetical protein